MTSEGIDWQRNSRGSEVVARPPWKFLGDFSYTDIDYSEFPCTLNTSPDATKRSRVRKSDGHLTGETEMSTLNLRVENHTCDHDVTYAYLQNADWAPSEGVQYNAEECTLSGDNPEQVWADYKSLAAVIAELGHGDSSETEAPILSACPAELIDLYSGGASEALARMNSVECNTWGEFVASVPSLTK